MTISLIAYSPLQIVSPDPVGAGGLALNTNFKAIADHMNNTSNPHSFVGSQLDAAGVTYAKIQNVSATSRFLGRKTANAGSIEELSNADAKTILAITQADVSGLTTASTPVFAGMKDSGLTSGRVVYTTTNGELTDSTNLTFNGTQLTTLGLLCDTSTLWVDTTYHCVSIGQAEASGRRLRVKPTANDSIPVSVINYANSAEIFTVHCDASGNGIARVAAAGNGNEWYLNTAGNSWMAGTGGNFGFGTVSPASLVHVYKKTTMTGTLGDSQLVTLEPALDGAYTNTRANYITCKQIALTNSAAVTNGCVFYFDAAIGTHKAIDAASTKSSPGTVTAWVKININGTVHYMPAYSSKTS